MPIEPETAKNLKRLEWELREARAELDKAIAEAHEAGATLRDLEAVLSVSHQGAANAIKRHQERQEAGGETPRGNGRRYS